MRAYVASLEGQTVTTVAKRNPNTIIEATNRRALVRTLTGENWVSLQPLQELADRVYAGEEVTVPTRSRSFAERYGDLGEGFIECHHRDALSEGARDECR